ncbi:hypothetical protein R1flu_023725 [Riccia fluitans]|uniref:Uncharacterized protein n=1 Tax=Riccia fluitans TaxID=41844 RepID=A0ABD1XTN9_9MARC
MPCCFHQARRRLYALLILIFAVCELPSNVSCSRSFSGAFFVFHLDSSSQKILSPPPPPDPSSTTSQLQSGQRRLASAVVTDNHDHAQNSAPPVADSHTMTDKEDQGLDRPLQQRDSKVETTGSNGREKVTRKPPSFQMLPRNTRPPPRGPSPGSNGAGN